MSSDLFDNKYYRELFGGDVNYDMERSEDTRDRLERIFGNKQNGGNDDNTEDRLERIFGGNQKQADDENTEDRLRRIFGMDTMAGGAAAPKRKSSRKAKKGTIRVLRNGARVRVMSNGKYRFVSGPKKSRRSGRRAAKKVSLRQAKRAFSNWARDKVAAAEKTGNKKAVAAAKRTISYHKTHRRAASKRLSTRSPKGYLYLKKGGPGRYNFVGVNPLPGTPRRKVSRRQLTSIRRARRSIKRSRR